jgi:hypothetical protein
MNRWSVCLTLCWLWLAGAAAAQSLTGTIIGQVRDSSGAVLPGATVTITSPAQPSGPRSVVTDARGAYRFTQLAPGNYELVVTLSGFSNYQEQGLRVALSGTTERIVTLSIAELAETITVSGESPMVDPHKVGVTGTLETEEVEALPRLRNSIIELVKWAPGVAASDPSGGSASLSVMGSNTDENQLNLDGAASTNPQTGGTWSSGDVDAVEEVQVVTLGASAEYQYATGGVFNVAFKQGTNQYLGDASAYFYPDSLQSKPIKLNCNCDKGQTGFTNEEFHNYSFHLGGPIKRDRVWFYGGGNIDKRRQGNPGTDPSRLPTHFYSDAAFGKVTWQISDRLKYTGYYLGDWWGGQSIPTLARPQETLAPGYGYVQTYSNEVTFTATNSTLITARVSGFVDLGYENRPFSGDYVTPIRFDQLTGIATGGVNQFGVSDLTRHGQSLKISHYRQGRVSHEFRGGVQFEFAHLYDFRAFPSGVQYNDVGGRPDQATFRDPFVSGAAYTSQGVWAEDQITLGNRTTVSVGLRFDRIVADSPDLPAVDNLTQKTGQTIQGLGKMFTWTSIVPRLGLNVKLREDGKTVLRSAIGRAYRPLLFNEFQNVHPGLSRSTLTRFDPATNAYTTIISVTDPIANIAVDPDINQPYTDSYSVGLDHELMANLAVSATYVHKRAENLIGWRDVSGVYGTTTTTLPDGRRLSVFPLLNSPSQRRFLRTNGPGAHTRYNGIVTSLTKRLSNRWHANVSYTYSKAEGQLTTGQDPNDSINLVGHLDYDRPHMFLALATYQVPKIDVDVTTNFMAVQGFPYAPQALVQLPQGRRSVNIEPPGDFRLPTQELLGIRFTKSLLQRGHRRIDLSAEVLNSLQDLGHRSVVSQNFFATTFGAPSQYIEPRRMQFVIRTTF